MKLSIVIPVYNEEATLREIVARVLATPHEKELLLVDDCSQDSSPEIIALLVAEHPEVRSFRHETNLGKGAALRRGCLAAQGRYVMFMDADNATRIEEIDKFLLLCEEGYGMVAGVRTFQEGESRLRRIIGLGFLMFAHLFVFRKAVVDSQCGFKCFTRDAARAIFARTRTNGGTIDVEIFFLAHKLDIPIYFVPVHWQNAEGSTINIWRCIVQDPVDMLNIRIHDKLGRYSRSS